MSQADFEREQQQWRDARLQRLTQPDGWTTLIGLHWIEPGTHKVGSAAGNDIVLAKGPAQLGTMRLQDDGDVEFKPADGVALTLDGKPLTAATELHDDRDGRTPGKLGFDDGKGVLTLILRSGKHALRVKHADAETRTQFAGLEYWPANPSWKIMGRYIAHPAGKTIPIANIIGTMDETPNPGAFEFEHEGKTHRLELLDEGDDTLFVVFGDRTNGKGSYGAGRFIDAPRPDAQGRMTVDFNQSYSPPCSFTPFATCPLPPPENRLDIEVEAGEKAYKKSH